MSIVRKCMTIMSIIITEEDLCKKHAKKCAKICQFSSLPSKCFQAVNDPNTKIDSKPHICAYNYNTRTGFRDHKKTWGSSVLSSALIVTPGCKLAFNIFYCVLWIYCLQPPSITDYHVAISVSNEHSAAIDGQPH